MRTMRRVAFVVIGCLVTSLIVLVVLIVWLGLGAGLTVGFGLAALVIAVHVSSIGPRQRRWGATDEEVERAMPGDELLRPGVPSTTRAIAIDADPRDVFPWLVQIGYGRGGWYSHDWIDNDGRRSPDRIDPALQGLAVGDRIQMTPGLGPIVREIQVAVEAGPWRGGAPPYEESAATRRSYAKPMAANTGPRSPHDAKPLLNLESRDVSVQRE